MPRARSAIISALEQERADAVKGVAGEVVSVGWEDDFLTLTVTPKAARTKLKLDEQLEGALAKWGDALEGVAVIKLVDADNACVVLRPVAGSPPEPGDTVWVFPTDFLGPLCDLWSGEAGAVALARYKQSQTDLLPIHTAKPLPTAFAGLRERQAQAVQSYVHRSAVIVGPPGTGKSYTVGALVAYLLSNFSKARVLIVGPTNVAVDGALLAVDDWLQRLGRMDLARQVKRVGAYFNATKLHDRPHLLAPEIEAAVNEYLLLEAEEPSRAKVGEHVRWKERMAAARQALASDIAVTAANARVVAATTATAVRWKDALGREQKWHFVICDEASQVLGPASMMMASLGQQVIFAGDPHQLSPIVQSDAPAPRDVLTETAFDLYAHSHTVRLNEQSRMTDAICQAVGKTFYDGDLKVCRRVRHDPAWQQERSPYFVDGRKMPRLCFQQLSEPATFSQRYGGFIRFQSAKFVESVCDELAGSYVDPDEVLVLTPFRAQRALLKLMLQKQHPSISVSTVHRAQGSERTVVIFDPVDGTAQMLTGKEGARLINVAFSRAKAHVIVPFHSSDLANPPLAQMHELTSQLWNQPGKYATPFRFKVAA